MLRESTNEPTNHSHVTFMFHGRKKTNAAIFVYSCDIHLAHSETINGQVLQLGAAVGLLTHNIKIIGEDYPQMYSESCGARVLVGLVIHRGQTYTGMFY